MDQINLALIPLRATTIKTFLASIPTVVAIYASFNYYADFLQAQSQEFYDPYNYEEFDFIVVGIGSTGSVIANRLSKNNRVLLLEAGSDPSPMQSIPSMAIYMQRLDSTDYQYKTTSQNNSCHSLIDNQALWPRGKGLGGSSNLNFMIYQRGNPKDFEEWARITKDNSWSYENLLPFFKKSENYNGYYTNEKFHGKSGPLYVGKLGATYMDKFVLKAAAELGYKIHDLNTFQEEGFSHIDVTIKNGRRWGTYPAFVKPILERKNLKLYRYARVVKIHLDKNKNAYGVTYFRHGMKKFVRASKEIIISAGAIDSPRLLMLSGIGVKKELNSVGIKCRVHLPVGKNLLDHVTTLIGPILHNSTQGFLADRDTTLDALNEYGHGGGPLSSIAGISAVGYISTSYAKDKKQPDIQYLVAGSGVHSSLADDFGRIFNTKPHVLKKFYGPHEGKDANFVLVTLGKPRSAGDIRLASNNPFDKPIIEPNYYKDKKDIFAMVEGVKFIVNLYEKTNTYRDIGAHLTKNLFPGCEKYKLKSLEYYECYLRHLTMTLYHPSSTCRMSANLTEAVLDTALRVRKTRGLRVIDASSFPTITNANLNAPCIMLGEKGSYLIRSYWAQQFANCQKLYYYFLYVDNMCFYSFIP